MTEENGEPKLSKNELKRRLKAERLAQKKAEKEAAKAATAAKAVQTGEKVFTRFLSFSSGFRDRRMSGS